MEPITMLLVYGSISAIKYFSQNYNKKTLSDAPKSPEKIISFIGATGVGKSSTINALLDNEICTVGIEHGTTKKVCDYNYINGYKVRDTPGLLDTENYLSVIWPSVLESQIVVYTTGGQAYRKELEFLEKLFKEQNKLNQETGAKIKRQLMIYINKQDLREFGMSKSMHEKEISAIYSQFEQYAQKENIIFGSSRPIKNGIMQKQKIDALQSTINKHILI
jgi:predicted GTPase